MKDLKNIQISEKVWEQLKNTSKYNSTYCLFKNNKELCDRGLS